MQFLNKALNIFNSMLGSDKFIGNNSKLLENALHFAESKDNMISLIKKITQNLIS